MDKLLSAVLDAHGGLKNWGSVKRITVDLSLGGPFWAARGWPDAYSRQTVTLDARREHIRFEPFTAHDLVSTLDVDPERVTISTAGGQLVEERANPRLTFPLPFELDTPWDAIQVAYFTGAACWNYFTAPFVFTYPDVEAYEISPWIEGDQTWRRLAVKFPTTIANHNPDQVFYYDDTHMLRRMDYSPDVTGNPSVAHYVSDHKTFDDFVFPTRRRVHLQDEKGRADRGFAPITIDLASVTVHRS